MNILQQFNLKKDHSADIGSVKYTGFINWQKEIVLDHFWHNEFAFCDHPYRIVWINIEEKGIFTFTEGDLTLEIFNDRVDFYKKLVKCAEFYKNN
jgi:hypothetical protein